MPSKIRSQQPATTLLANNGIAQEMTLALNMQALDPYVPQNWLCFGLGSQVSKQERIVLADGSLSSYYYSLCFWLVQHYLEEK